MKNEWVWGVFFVMILSFQVSAISTNLKDSYSAGETAIVKIDGNIIQMNKDNFELKREHVVVPVEYDLKKIGENYYLWFISPENINNYSIALKNVETSQNGNAVKLNYIQNFTINQNKTDYSIKPGFFSGKEDVLIDIENYGDNSISIPISAPISKDILINPGKNTLQIKASDIPTGVVFPIRIGKYETLVYVPGKETPIVVVEERVLRASPIYISDEIIRGGDLPAYKIEVYNSGNRNLKKVSIDYDKDLFSIEPESFSNIDIGEKIRFNVSIKKADSFNKNIEIFADNESVVLPISLEIRNKPNLDGVIDITNKSLLYCSELSGTLCKSDDSCSGEFKNSKEGKCCVGICKLAPAPSSSWIGYLIGVIIVAIILYFIGKYRKMKAVNPLDKKLKDIKEKTGEKSTP